MNAVILESSVLVLNRSFHPIHVTPLKRAFGLLYAGVAKAVDEQFRLFDFESWTALSSELGGETVGTPCRRIRVPRVILLTAFDRLPRAKLRFSRLNIYTRDENTCQYCGAKLPRSELNLDHVIPRSRGGSTSWENVVCSCIPCNLKKANGTPEQAGMTLMKKPVRPRWSPMFRPPGGRAGYREWLPFLTVVDASYWHTELLEE